MNSKINRIKVEICLKKTATILLLLLFSMLFISFVTKGQTIKEKVTQKIGTLNTLINSAHTSGIETLKEELTIRTAEIFMGYADWDEVNINKNTSYFEETWHYKDNASQMANLLPDFERQDIQKASLIR